MHGEQFKLGISMAYLQEVPFYKAAETFLALQSEFALGACEIHMEGIQFAAGFCRPGPAERAALSVIRGKVDVLGFHLPYLDLNPVSADPDIAGFALARFHQAIRLAGDAGADYAVFHARGRYSPDSERKLDLESWLDVVAQLSEWATARNLIFCLENADDLRSIHELADLGTKIPQLSICLDIGHLFERLEQPFSLKRVAARLWDRYLPWSALVGKGMPFFEAGEMSGCLKLLAERIRCIHVHNHNGKMAHQPVSEGKIDIGRVMRQAVPAGIPVILEADYRLRSMDTIKNDLCLIKEWLR